MSNVKNYTEQGGDKTVIRGILEVAEGGKLTFVGAELKPGAAQADSAAATIEGLVADFNALLSKLRTAGIIKT